MHTTLLCIGLCFGAMNPDFDQDTDVDQDDFGQLQLCIGSDATECQRADLNESGVVDDADFEVFQQCASGSDIATPCRGGVYVYYVDVTNPDATNGASPWGESWATPWKNIRYALQMARSRHMPDDLIVLNVRGEHDLAQDGISTKWLDLNLLDSRQFVIQGESVTGATITATSTPENYGYIGYGTPGTGSLTLRRLTFRNQGVYPIRIGASGPQSSFDLKVEDCRFTGTSDARIQPAIYFAGRDLTVLRTTIDQPLSTGIQFGDQNKTSGNLIVDSCTIANNTPAAPAIRYNGAVGDVTITNSELDAAQGYAFSGLGTGHRSVYIANCRLNGGGIDLSKGDTNDLTVQGCDMRITCSTAGVGVGYDRAYQYPLQNYPRNIAVTHNRITYPASIFRHGIIVGAGAEDVTIAYNQVSGAWYQIVYKGSNGRIHHNICKGNIGILACFGENNAIEYNSVFGMLASSYACSLGSNQREVPQSDSGVVSINVNQNSDTMTVPGWDLSGVAPGWLICCVGRTDGIDSTSWFIISDVNGSEVRVAPTPTGASATATGYICPVARNSVVRYNVFDIGTGDFCFTNAIGSWNNLVDSNVYVVGSSRYGNLIYGRAANTLDAIQNVWSSSTFIPLNNDLNSIVSTSSVFANIDRTSPAITPQDDFSIPGMPSIGAFADTPAE